MCIGCAITVLCLCTVCIQNTPAPHVAVVVISAISINALPVSQFQIKVAVPKVVRAIHTLHTIYTTHIVYTVSEYNKDKSFSTM